MLLQRPQDPDLKTGTVTPLHVACQCGSAEAASLLLEARADKDKSVDDEAGRSPMCMAALEGHLPVVRLLLEAKADKEKATNEGETPVALAFCGGHLEVVRVLLDAGVDKDKASNDGATPLFVAAESGRSEVIQLLLASGADKNKAVIEAEEMEDNDASRSSQLRKATWKLFGCFWRPVLTKTKPQTMGPHLSSSPRRKGM